MAIERLPHDQVGEPLFPTAVAPGGVFALASHARAKVALDFGIGTSEPGFNIFVTGVERSGRLTQTVSYLREVMRGRPAPSDWLYLNNFRRPHRPRPCRVPAGMGRRFRDAMQALVPDLRTALQHAFEDEKNQALLQAPSARLQEEVTQQFSALKAAAEEIGLSVVQAQTGPTVVPSEPLQAQMAEMSAEEIAKVQAGAQSIAKQLSDVSRAAAKQQPAIAQQVKLVATQIAEEAASDLIADLSLEFSAFAGLQRWIEEMRADVLENFQLFSAASPDSPPVPETPEQRYSVNLFVDNGENHHPNVVIEPNPTYEKLFGRFEYRQAGMGVETDFTLLRSGALHRANGGVLVLRAEALAAQPVAWQFLKGALRDGEVQIDEMRNPNAPPLVGAPRPKGIPLELTVVIIGGANWYHTFLASDPEFQTYFKVKAEIDHDLPATAENVAIYAGLLQELGGHHGVAQLDEDAVRRLLGHAARLAGDRTRLTAQFEILEDIIAEARICTPAGPITGACIEKALAQRRARNSRVEDITHERIADGTVLIQTAGAVTGQINGLTVRDTGDHSFGGPSRVTARASVGRQGIINIERDVAMSGPIQQKAAMILQGYLAGKYARKMPLSFDCSITFEQNYGGVEGDSASLAEAVAVISAISQIPARQDIAITGSMNQRGEAQVVGGVIQKIEGFFRACAETSIGLTGTQGAIVPAANAKNLVLSREVSEAVSAGTFHIWTVETLEDALTILLKLDVEYDVRHSSEQFSAMIDSKVEDELANFTSHLDRCMSKKD